MNTGNGLVVISYTPPPPTITNFTVGPASACVGDAITASFTVGNVSGSYSYTLTETNSGDTYRLTTSDNPAAIRFAYDSPGVRNYSLRVVSNGQQATAGPRTVTINALPTQYNVTGGGSYCANATGQAVGLSGSQSGVSYQLLQSGTPLGSPLPGTGSALTFGPQPAGTYTVRATNTSTSCQQTMTGSAVITATQPPTATLGNDGPITCTKPSVTLTAGGGGSYVFSAGATQVNGGNTARVTQAGTYTVTVSANGCSSFTTTTVQSNTTAPSVSINPANQTLCQGQTATFTASGADAYTWNTGATTASISVVANESTSYSVRGTSAGNGCSATASAQLTVNAQPVATLTASPSPVLSCTQTSLTLTAGGGTSYSFSGPGIVSQGSNQAVVNAPGTYSVTVTSAGCTSTTSIAISQDNTTPAASLASSGTLSCSLTSVTLTASPGGQAYRFSPGASQLGTTNQATVTTAGVYSVTVLAGNGCTSVASTTVTGDQSVPPVSIDPASATLTCASPTATLRAIGTGSFRWNTGAQTATIPVTTAGIYSVTLTGSNGCLATASALVSSDQTPPSVSISPASGTLTCGNPSLTLTANTSAPSLRWSNGATTPSITVSTAGTYSVTATGANGCSATSSPVLIESNQTTPPATLVASSELSCRVTSVTLTANPGNDLSYRFSSGATQLGTSNAAMVNLAGTYSVTVTNTATGCTSTASVVVGQDNSQPTLSIDPATATLTCAAPRVLLTANSSASSLTWSTGQTTTSISVSVAGTYSVTATSANGCVAMAMATVSGTTTAPSAPTLSASPAPTTTNQPVTVTAGGCPGGVINWTALGGTGQANGNTYTLAQPGNYTLSATCTLNGCTSSSSTPLSVQIRPGGFAITGVSMVNCQLTNPARGEYQVQFTPQYTGQTSSPITFSVVNELAPTTVPAPYSLRLYTDNSVITLVATQAGNGEARFAYNWLASCQSGTSPNQPPTTTGIPNQTLVQGQGYQLALTSYFSDPDGQQLSFQTSGLPAGLGLTGSVISGTPSQTGVSTVTVTALDPGGLQVGTSFQLTVSPMPVTPPTGFAIVGVSTVSCQVLSAGERRLSFTPQYGGVSGAPISFSVVNELAPTTNPGPYSLRLYTDNPSITLSAQQGTAVSTFRYNWLAGCNPAARVGSGEAGNRLQVRVLGNPVEGSTAEVEISGASGQPLQLDVVDMQGKSVTGQRIDQASSLERVRLPLGASSGVLLLRVSTPGQHQQLKLVRP
ncbi:beta strand repeat-containing protein [Spirosoma pomorum]